MKGIEKIAEAATKAINTSTAFTLALATIIIWGISGPIFKFSDTWQLVINTSTTIITFLLGFLIARTQSKESKAINLKLDEIIASQPGASSRLLNIEELSEEEIDRLHQRYIKLKEVIERTGPTKNIHSIEDNDPPKPSEIT